MAISISFQNNQVKCQRSGERTKKEGALDSAIVIVCCSIVLRNHSFAIEKYVETTVSQYACLDQSERVE
jgi:hypothetical protein